MDFNPVHNGSFDSISAVTRRLVYCNPYLDVHVQKHPPAKRITAIGYC